jgi:hypothetical protein
MEDNNKVWLRGSREHLTWRGDVEVEHFDLEVDVDKQAKSRLVERLVDADLNGIEEVQHARDDFDFSKCLKLFMKQSGWNGVIDDLYLDFGNGWHTSLCANRSKNELFTVVCRKQKVEREDSNGCI